MKSEPDTILFSAATVDVQAAAPGKRPSVAINAYNGGELHLPEFPHPVIADLAGMKTAGEDTPILYNHDELIGQGRATISATSVQLAGSITGDDGAAASVVQHSKNGFRFQASIGAKIKKRELISQGQTANVNGRRVDGPKIIARQTELHEISIVPVGADASTSATISAKARMTKMLSSLFGRSNEEAPVVEQKPPGAESDVDLVRAEQDRQVSILRACGGQFPDIQARGIQEGWKVEQVQLEVLRAGRSREYAPGGAPPSHPLIRGSQATPLEILAAAGLMRIGHESLAEKIGPQAAQCARDLRCRHVLDICAAALELEGKPVPRGQDQMIRAAFSTASLPNALADILHRVLFLRYGEMTGSWESFVFKGIAPDFRPQMGIRPGAVEGLSKVSPSGELNHTVIREESSYSYSVDTFGRMATISRKDLVNDDLGYFDQLGSSFGQAAKRSATDLVYRTLMANAGSFFGVGNGNYASGGGTALSLTSLAAAVAAMRKQVDWDGNNIDVSPAVLLVPPELEVTARGLISSEYLQQLIDTLVPTGNPLKGLLKVEVEPRLSNTATSGVSHQAKFSNASATGWYLFGAPQSIPVIFATLEGSQGPSVQFFGLDQNPSILAASYRVFYDYGAALADPKACYFAAGA